MKLRCLLGSISCDGALAEKGDTFEVGDKAGAGLVASGYAEEVVDVLVVEPDTEKESVSFVPPMSGKDFTNEEDDSDDVVKTLQTPKKSKGKKL